MKIIEEGICEFLAELEELNNTKEMFIKAEFFFDEHLGYRFAGENIFKVPSFWSMQDIIGFSISMLSHYGYNMEGIDSNEAVDLQMLAELTNWAAKNNNPAFYKLKAFMVVAAAHAGAEISYNGETYSLFSKQVGVSGFHDPIGEIEDLLEESEVKISPSFSWSGIRRQDMAYEILRSYIEGGSLHKKMAYLTKPGRVLSNRLLMKVESLLEAA